MLNWDELRISFLGCLFSNLYICALATEIRMWNITFLREKVKKYWYQVFQ